MTADDDTDPLTEDPAHGRGIVPPWILDAIDRAADRVKRGDTLETLDGTLVHARIGDLTLDSAPLHDRLLISIPDTRVGFAVMSLDRDEARSLHHALGTFLWPYAETPPLLDGGSPKHG